MSFWPLCARAACVPTRGAQLERPVSTLGKDYTTLESIFLESQKGYRSKRVGRTDPVAREFQYDTQRARLTIFGVTTTVCRTYSVLSMSAFSM
jgi:hypothetical protein